MRLGELLVAEGLLKDSDVEKALELQKLRGGRLGTNLVALQVVTEEQLANVLAKQMGIESARWSDFKDIPSDVIDTVPMELADIHSAIPLRKNNSTVVIGVSSPIETVARERLEKMVGFSFTEAIAPEVWIAAALERYYNISREWRFDQSQDLLAQDGCSLLLPVSLLSCFQVSSAEIKTGKKEDRYLQNLFEADTPKRALNEFMEYLWYHYPRQAVFSVEGDDIRGWIARGFPTHAVVFHETVLARKRAKFVSKVLETEESFHGPLNLQEEEVALFKPLHAEETEKISLYPVIIENRPLAVFAGWPKEDSEEEKRQENTAWALEKLNLALRILALKYHLFRA